MSFYFGEKTWPEIDEYIKKKAVIILPIGTTEEHGLHLPVETDAMIAKHFGDELGKACEMNDIAVLVMRTIYYGFSMKAVRKFPGCPNIRSRHLMDYVFDIIDSLIRMGFVNIVLLDCHGNHDGLIRTVMREIADEHSIFVMTLSPLCTPHALSKEKYREIRRDENGDIHAGEWETSAILHIRPDLVHKDKYTNVDSIRCNGPLLGPVSTWGLQETRTGTFGDPTYADGDLGRILLQDSIDKGIELIKQFIEVNKVK